MSSEPSNSRAWWIPRVRWLVVLLAAIVVPPLLIPVVRYQSACRWVEQHGGHLRADAYEIGGFTIYLNVEEVYLKRGTIDNPPSPAFVSIEQGDLARLRALPRLEKLVIAGYELPDTRRREIASLGGLKHIDVIRTNVTEEDALALFEELPECSIRYSFDGNPSNNTWVRPSSAGPADQRFR